MGNQCLWVIGHSLIKGRGSDRIHHENIAYESPATVTCYRSFGHTFSQFKKIPFN